MASNTSYFCCYCENIFHNFQSIIEHFTDSHADLELKLRVARGTSTKILNFRIVPNTYKLFNKTIKTVPNSEKLKISKSDATCISSPFQTPKKPKWSSTPKKINPQIDNEDSTIVSNLSSNFNNMSLDELELTNTDSVGCQTNASVTIPIPDDKDLDKGLLNEIVEMLPLVMETLEEHGHQHAYLKFNKLLRDKKLPMTNIAYLLFLDIVQWFSETDSHQMRYSKEVKQFWSVGVKLFKGKFLRFMGGWKNQGQEPQGRFDPQASNVNQINDKNTQVLKNIKPRIMQEMIDLVSADDITQTQTYKLCVDGKKINAGVQNQSMGDIDLWGYEGPPSLTSQRNMLNDDLSKIEDLKKILSKLEMRNVDLIKDIPDYFSDSFVDIGRNVIQRLSIRIKELRSIKVTKEIVLEKLKKVCINEQMKYKYSYAISSIKTYLFQIGISVDRLLRLVDSISYALAEVNHVSEMFCDGQVCDLSVQSNYICITGVEKDVSKETISNIDLPAQIKQGSDTWKQTRNLAKVTGSTLHTAIGLNGLKKQQKHHDNVFKTPTPPEFTDLEKQRMQYGVDNEINAVATLVSKVLPVFTPDMSYVEEGCRLKFLQKDVILVVSPDGSVRKHSKFCDTSAIQYGVEIKCPFPGKMYTTPVYYKLPYYYALQVLSEMAVQDTDALWFMCYSTESSSIFNAKFDAMLWQHITKKVVSIYSGESGSFPKRLASDTKELANALKEYCEKKVEFICEVKSVRAMTCSHDSVSTDERKIGYNRHDVPVASNPRVNKVSDIQKIMFDASESINKAYSLCRRIANEVLVFLVSDLDRLHTWERQYSVPVGYAMKGYSMTTKLMRSMVEDVLNTCYERGLYIPVVSYDGQWYNMAVRSKTNEPLTILQLQKDVFKAAKATPKSEILKAMSKANVIEAESFDEITQKVECYFNIDESRNIVGPIIVGKLITGEPPFIVSRSVYNALKLNTSTKTSKEADLSLKLVDSRNMVMETLSPVVADSLDDEVIDNMAATTLHNTCTLNNNLGMSISLDRLFDEECFTNKEQDVTQMEVESTITYDDTEDPIETSHVENKVTTNAFENLSRTILSEMLSELNNDKEHTHFSKWKGVTPENLKQMFKSTDDIRNAFTRAELKVCLSVLRTRYTNVHFAKSWKKDKLIDEMDKILFRPQAECKKRARKSPLLSLKTLCKRKVAKVPKGIYNIILAERVFPEKLSKWQNDNAFKSSTYVVGLDTLLSWYSKPEYVPERYIQMFHMLDCHHLFANARVKCCSSGMVGVGIKKEAWMKVAKDSQHNNSGLNTALVEDLIDKQSNAYAKKTFSTEVENVMKKNGDFTEATFCRLIREWYEAEDDPGLSAIERCRRRLAFREWLLKDVHFNQFPPPGNHIKGIPLVMFEGILTNIERRIQLYPFVKQGTFNVRALGSLEVENLFGEFQDLDPRGSGIIRPDDIPLAISNACELVNARMDPNRAFHMHTSKAKVYPIHELLRHSEMKLDTEFINPDVIDCIKPRNHVFDLNIRGQRACKRKRGEISKPGMSSRGAQPVRQHHRCDETKILPHVRMGIELQDEQ